MLMLLACSATAPWASVDSDRDAPVAIAKRLRAYFVETSESRSGGGDALLVLIPDEVECSDVVVAAQQALDADNDLFGWEGLAFHLSFETGDGATDLTWEALYWGAEATSVIGQRSLSAWLLTGGSLMSLDGGWLELTEHANELVAGAFDVSWYAGEFAAEHCGTALPVEEEPDDTGADTGA